MSVLFLERTIGAQDGLKLYLRDYGDPMSTKVPLLCLGGLTRNSKDYHPLASRLSAHRRVLCLDYRGRGRSQYDSDWRNYRPEIYLSDIMAVLTALDLHPVAICGTSMGGLLAMGLAAVAPTTVAGAILNDVGPDIDKSGLARILEYIGEDRPKDNWDEAAGEVKSLFSQLGYQDKDRWLDYAKSTYREGDDGRLHFDWDVNLARPLKESSEPSADLWKLYTALATRPVLAIRGEVSDIFKPETLHRMAEIKADLRQITVAGVGHTPSLDEPEVELAIDEFLNALDASTRH